MITFIQLFLRGEIIVFLILHWAFVWPLFVYRPNKFNFFGLSLGAIMPDLEVPFLFVLTGETWKARAIMHSVLGAMTIDLVLALFIIIFLIPVILKLLDKRIKNKKWFFFSNIDLRNHKTDKKILFYSVLIGTVSHVFIDIIHHHYNPLTYPFEQYYDFNLVLFNDLKLANIVTQGMAFIFLLIMVYFWYFRQFLKK